MIELALANSFSNPRYIIGFIVGQALVNPFSYRSNLLKPSEQNCLKTSLHKISGFFFIRSGFVL